jgi:hypothetical protein
LQFAKAMDVERAGATRCAPSPWEEPFAYYRPPSLAADVAAETLFPLLETLFPRHH